MRELTTITILKTNLCLDYFAKSLEHSAFSLINVPSNKTIHQIRKEPGNSTIVSFNPEDSLLELKEKNPKNYQIDKTLGIFYYEKYRHYSMNQSKKQNDKQIQQSKQYLITAYENNEKNWKSCSILGFYSILDKNYNRAIKYLDESVSFDENHGINNYNLAFCLFKQKEFQKALKHSDLAILHYDKLDWKMDAGNLSHKIAISMGNRDESLRTAIAYLALNPESHTILKNVISNYYRSNYAIDVIKFLDRSEDQFKNNKVALGNIYLYRSIFYKDKKEKNNAQKNLNNAANIFNEIYEKNHSVFNFINVIQKEIDKL